MGLKGYMLWVMGQLDSTCRAPPQVVLEADVERVKLGGGAVGGDVDALPAVHDVAVHKFIHLKGCFETRRSHYRGQGLRPGAFKLRVNCIQL